MRTKLAFAGPTHLNIIKYENSSAIYQLFIYGNAPFAFYACVNE